MLWDSIEASRKLDSSSVMDLKPRHARGFLLLPVCTEPTASPRGGLTQPCGDFGGSLWTNSGHSPTLRTGDSLNDFHLAGRPDCGEDGRRSCPLLFSNRPSGSSTFRLSTTPVSMSLTGSCFSSDSAPRPFHHGDSKSLSRSRRRSSCARARGCPIVGGRTERKSIRDLDTAWWIKLA